MPGRCPAGSGKTTLLAQWRAEAGGGRVAWVSLEESDNDPTQFWSYLVAALRTVEPTVGTVALEALGGPSVELERVVVPSLVNDLAAVEAPLVLVLDDYHLITNATCHQTLGWFLDQLPARSMWCCRLGLPAAPLARMRARGAGRAAGGRAAVHRRGSGRAAERLDGPGPGGRGGGPAGRTDRGLGGRAGPGRPIAARPAEPQRLCRRLLRR